MGFAGGFRAPAEHWRPAAAAPESGKAGAGRLRVATGDYLIPAAVHFAAKAPVQTSEAFW